jgi:hypothetical protein
VILFLADHNVEGQAKLIFGALNAGGWLELLPLRLLTLAEAGLPEDSTDLYIWQVCQQRQMILLTANRSMHEPDSLEAVLRTKVTSQSLPVVTIADPQRVGEPAYLKRCVLRLVEIALDLDSYRGAGRLYIP